MVGQSTCERARFFMTVAEVGSNRKLPHPSYGAAGYTVETLHMHEYRKTAPSSKAKAKKVSAFR